MVPRLLVGLALALVAPTIAAASGAATAVKVTLTVTVKGRGKVTGPGGIVCPSKCRAQLGKGAVATLTAKPRAGWKFSGWSGGCTGTKPQCKVRLTASKRVAALFVLPPAPSGFTPQLLAGSWQGTWNDTRFSTSGPASVVVAVQDSTTFTFTLNLGGNVFGCSPPPPTAATITKGNGPNQWNPSGFTIQITGPLGGTISVKYDFATKTLSGTGRPGCRPSVTWALNGTFSGNTFNGMMTTTLEDGSTAPAVITLTRS
jgi:hypothetical protein